MSRKEAKMEARAEKERQKTQALLERYGLQEITNPIDIQSVRQIVGELAGTGLMELGITLGGNEKDALRVQMYYQRAIVEQNFMIIRQLDRISKALQGRDDQCQDSIRSSLPTLD